MEQRAMNTLPRHVRDERNGLDYTLYGDYYLPDLEVPLTPPLNRWGRMAFDTLRKQHSGRFNRMLLDGTLYPYCHDISQQAKERYPRKGKCLVAKSLVTCTRSCSVASTNPHHPPILP